MLPKRLYTSPRSDRGALENIGIGFGEVIKATTSHAYDDSFSIRTPWHQYTGKSISEEDFNKKYQSSGVPYDPSMTEELAEFLVEKKRVREIDEYVISLGKGGKLQTAAQVVTGMIAANLTPVNLAASFIPIGGQAKWAGMAAKYGSFKVGLAKGFVGGAAGQAVLEPFTHYERKLEGRDYSLKDSAENIFISGTFGSTLHAGIYGFKKLKDRYFTTPETLSHEASTDNPVINKQFKDLIDSLADNTYPKGTDSAGFDITEAQHLKNTLWQDGRDKFPEFFEQEHKIAHFEEMLEQEFAIGGDKSKIPAVFLRQLDAKKNKLEYLREEYSNNPDFVEITERLRDIDSGILNRLEYEQQALKAYDFSPTDLYLAKSQLEDGKHIDLGDPNNARSIYETDANPEIALETTPSTDILSEKSATINSELDIFSKAVEFIQKHQSKKIGFSEYLRQTDLKQQTIAKEWLYGFMQDLEKADLTIFFKNKNYSKNIARELANLSTNHHTQGYTGSKRSLEIARIVHRWQNIARERANRAGADIAELPGYVTRQMHSGKALRTMGYNKWRDFITPLLDLERTGDIDFKSVFESLATGLHFDNLDHQIPTLSGHSNLAKAISESRKLHFKSADSWLAYNEFCGEYNLADSILLGLESLGKATGMIEMFGTNPKDSFDGLKTLLLNDLKEPAANGDKIALSEEKYFSSLRADNIFDLMLGGNRPDKPTLAAIASSIRALKATSSLGSVVISSLPDMATWVSELANNGIPILKGYTHLLTDVLASMVSKDRRNFAKALGIASENTLGLAYSRLNADYPAVGVISKLSSLFFKLNCMEWWDSSFKSAMGLVLSNNLASQIHLKFDKLPKLLQQQLSRYGINENNWHLYKYFKQKEGSNYYLIPDGNLIPEQLIDNQTIRDNLANNLRRYFLDRVDSAITTPHSADKAFVTAGTKSGTWLGEFVRFFMQFKTFPVHYIRRPLYSTTLGRIKPELRTGKITGDLQMALSHPGTITSMTHLLMGTTLLGYLAIAAKNLLNNKEIPDPKDPKVWTASVIKGGGLGIFGDFIFNEYDRYGRTFLQEAAGPVFGEANSIASIISKYQQGQISKAEVEAAIALYRNIPGRNLFYLQPAIMWMQNN